MKRLKNWRKKKHTRKKKDKLKKLKFWNKEPRSWSSNPGEKKKEQSAISNQQEAHCCPQDWQQDPKLSQGWVASRGR